MPGDHDHAREHDVNDNERIDDNFIRCAVYLDAGEFIVATNIIDDDAPIYTHVFHDDAEHDALIKLLRAIAARDDGAAIIDGALDFATIQRAWDHKSAALVVVRLPEPDDPDGSP